MQSKPEGHDVAKKPSDWKPSNPSRWSMLGLADPDPSAALPRDAPTSDLLAWALTAPGAPDPVEGIVDGVRIELTAFASVAEAPSLRDFLMMLADRLHVGMMLLRRTDEREPTPPGDLGDEPPPSPPADGSTVPAPASPPALEEEDPERTHDGPPN